MRAIVLSTLVVLTCSCSQPPALITDARKAELLRTLQREFAHSVEGEKSAVLATTDEESERFAAESRKASAQVEQARKELRALSSPEERQKLDAFDAAWEEVAAIDAKLLPLATANTNLKAGRLSAGEAAVALDQVLQAIASAEAVTKDPARLRELSAASVADLRIQTLHVPHIASPDDAEMTALEARAKELERKVDAVLAPPARKVPPAEAQPLGAASKAWADYQRLTGTIFALSRQNTNVTSFAMSIHEKSDASKACDAALQGLVNQVHQAKAPTR